MRATRGIELCLSDLTAYDFARASAEVWWDEDRTPEKYISIMEFSPLGQINKKNNGVWVNVLKDHSRHLKHNLISWGGGNAFPQA